MFNFTRLYSTIVEYYDDGEDRRMQNAKGLLHRGPGRPSKRRIQGDLALLQAGQSAFARHGFEGASLRKIAAAAGVDPALAAHYFGSKEALWKAIIERMSLSLTPLIAELQHLQNQAQLPIRARLEKALRQLISATCEEPELGMLISRIGSEKGEKLKLLINRLLRPYHDAFRPLLVEAMRAKVIGKQPVEVLYFMLLHAVAMTISYRHILEYFGEQFDDIEQLKRAMTHCVLVTFFQKQLD
jgi:TetR/AcrR family transcriptional regulator